MLPKAPMTKMYQKVYFFINIFYLHDYSKFSFKNYSVKDVRALRFCNLVDSSNNKCLGTIEMQQKKVTKLARKEQVRAAITAIPI